jgi:hypothetical protein
MQPVRTAWCTPLLPGAAGTAGATLDEACAAGAGVLMFGVAPIPPNPTAKATAAAPLKVVIVILVRDFMFRPLVRCYL